MRALAVARLLGVLALLITLLGCAGVYNWVRVSPDRRYVTLLGTDEDDTAILLHDLQSGESYRVYPKPPDIESLQVYDVQWRPDSRAFCFIALQKHRSEQAPPAEETTKESALMLFEVDTRRLWKLPINSPALARWSRDGKRLLVLHQDEDKFFLSLFTTDTWVRLRVIPLPESATVVSRDTSHMTLLDDGSVVMLMELPSPDDASSGDYPEGSNLYWLRAGRWEPLTTTGDVQHFWIAPLQDRVRWVRVQEDRWLAVFECPLHRAAPRRIALVPSGAVPITRGQAYRFSPDGNKLAWASRDNLHVLDIVKGTIRTVTLTDLEPQSVSLGGWEKLEQSRYPVVGFDWRDPETLVIQRGDEVEIVSFRSIRR